MHQPAAFLPYFSHDIGGGFDLPDQCGHLPYFELPFIQVAFKHPFFSPCPAEQLPQFFRTCSFEFRFFYLFRKFIPQ